MRRLTCRRARTWILRARDADLGLEQGFRLEEHLRDCPECRELDQRSSSLEEALARQPEPPVERLDVEAAVSRVRAEIDRRADVPRRAPARRVRLALALGAAAVALAALALVAGPWRDRPGVAETSVASVESPEDGVDEPRSTAPLAFVESESELVSEPIDVDRLEQARTRTRAALLEALPLFDPSVEDAGAFVARLDELARPIAKEGWPLARLMERLLEDDDPRVAAAVTRYLGRHGDRLSTRQLERVLERSPSDDSGSRELRRQAVLALRDAGEVGLGGLGAALHDPFLVEGALRAVVATGGDRAARVLEDALDSRDPTNSRDLLAALAELGEPGFVTLMRLGVGGSVPAERVLDALVRVRDVRARVLERLDDAQALREVEFLLAATGRLQLEPALPWIAERCHERAHRPTALASLAAFDDGEALPLLVRLWDEGHVGDDEVLVAVAAAESRRPGQLADHVARIEHAEDLTILLRALLTGDGDWTGGALARLADSHLLSEDERVWAALAVGEVGATRELPRLQEVLAGLDPELKLLASACLLSIHTLGGEPAVRTALVGASPEQTERLVALLVRRARDKNTTTPLFKLARQLEPWLEAQNPERRRTSS